jgi:hypothetical protein
VREDWSLRVPAATDPKREFRSDEESSNRSENGDKAEIEPHRVATLGNEDWQQGDEKRTRHEPTDWSLTWDSSDRAKA